MVDSGNTLVKKQLELPAAIKNYVYYEIDWMSRKGVIYSVELASDFSDKLKNAGFFIAESDNRYNWVIKFGNIDFCVIETADIIQVAENLDKLERLMMHAVGEIIKQVDNIEISDYIKAAIEKRDK